MLLISIELLSRVKSIDRILEGEPLHYPILLPVYELYKNTWEYGGQYPTAKVVPLGENFTTEITSLSGFLYVCIFLICYSF